MKGTTYRKKLLPNVIQSIRPSSELIRRLLDEETFDFLKTGILENTNGRIGKTAAAIEKTKRQKAEKRAKREEIKKQLTQLYGEDIFTRFKSKRKRKEFAAGRLTSDQVAVLRHFTNKHKEQEKAKRRRAERHSSGKRTTYETYMSSKAWERRRNAFWQTHPKRCAVCDTAQHIHLHHMSYRKLGDEPDTHLIPLCRAHHAGYHEANGTQRDMIETTTLFVTRTRATLIA